MGVKHDLRDKFQGRKCGLEHDNVSDFYISCWQRSQSAIPLVLLRGMLFLGCLAIMVSSMILSTTFMSLLLWPIYMTHWGLVLITLTTGVGFYVSCKAYLKGPMDGLVGTPMCCKIYWVLYNITIPMAVLITFIYWVFLTQSEFGEIADETEMVTNSNALYILDFFIHLVNSLVMIFILLIDSQPTRVLHVYQPVLFAIVYLIFNVIYYLAGGENPNGNPWIYPILDWRNPGAATVMVVLTAVFIVVVHICIASVAVLRNRLTKRFRKSREPKAIQFS